MRRPWVRGGLVVSLLAWPASSWADGVPARVAALERVVAALQATVDSQRSQIAALKGQVGSLQTAVSDQAESIGKAGQGVAAIKESAAMRLNEYLEVTTQSDDSSEGSLPIPLIRLSGVNVQIVNGAGPGTTEAEVRGGVANRRGNLILGYNEQRNLVGAPLAVRTGSHNLVIGPLHGYEGSGGILTGFNNTVTGNHASITAGEANRAEGDYTSVSGGEVNTVRGRYGSISGGANNIVLLDALRSSISGGGFNRANNGLTSISGGRDNLTMEAWSSISGGFQNRTRGSYASVSGGFQNTAGGNYSSVSGGSGNFIDFPGHRSSVSGGTGINVNTPDTWAAGTFIWP